MSAASDRPQGRNGSIWSKRRIKKRGSRDGGGKQLKRRSVYATVHCEQHGIQPLVGNNMRELRCTVPRTRAQKYHLGCPKCLEKAGAH